MARRIISIFITQLNARKNQFQYSQINKFITNNNGQSSSSYGKSKPIVYSSLISGAIIFGGFYHCLTSKKLNNLSLTVSAAQLFGGDSNDTPKSDHFPPSKAYNFIADVTEKVSPAVVHIEVKGKHPYFNTIMTVSSGSGFIVNSDGIIITNAHVVGNHHTVSVKLYDGRIIEGIVEHVDEQIDLATVRINERNLSVIKLGDSRKVRAGEWVIAMGSPSTLTNTITVGIVSSVNRGSRELGLRQKEMEYIQTDAFIDVGNSGGPLVNLDGEAIGVNSMKASAGISFAIPSSYAIDFLQRAEMSRSKSWFGSKTGPPIPKRKRYIGITMLTLTPDLLNQFRSRENDFPDVSTGVLVWKVVLGSPAHVKGLLPGDVITHINGKPVLSARDVYNALDSGESLQFNIQRKYTKLSLTIEPQLIN